MMILDLHCGHVLTELAKLPDESVHCVVTSPPYWGLRSYKTEPQVWGGEAEHKHEWDQSNKKSIEYVQGNPEFARPHREYKSFSTLIQTCLCGAWHGELGLEPTPELYVQHLVEVFREVKRVLRSDSTCWINLGDSYAGSWGNYGDRQRPPMSHDVPGLKPKDLCGIPWRVAFALQADGWWLRSAITLCKLNPMPESVRDRPSSATEMMFLLTKSERYYYDQEAVRAPHLSSSLKRYEYSHHAKAPNDGFISAGSNTGAFHSERLGDWMSPAGRNLRNWWVVTTEPFPKGLTDDPTQAHFATFSQKWIEPCIRAGTSGKGCCAKCGAPWKREVQKTSGTIGRSWHNHENDLQRGQRSDPTMLDGSYQAVTLGWHPTCSCQAETIPCVVLDPFVGSGTTCLVALKLGRASIGIDLKSDFIEMTKRRIEQEVPLLARMRI